MFKKLAGLLLKMHGWKVDETIPPEAQYCVMIAAPHTSNWDGYFMRLAFFVLDIPLRFTIKDTWTKFPMGLFIRPLGGLGINRSGSAQERGAKSYVDQMKDFFRKHKRIAVVVTPEGSRSRNDKWKTGFYYTAIGAGVPIAFGYLDYEKKVAGVGNVLIHPTGNKEQDLKIMMNFYKDIAPLYPEKFAVDKRYI